MDTSKFFRLEKEREKVKDKMSEISTLKSYIKQMEISRSGYNSELDEIKSNFQSELDSNNQLLENSLHEIEILVGANSELQSELNLKQDELKRQEDDNNAKLAAKDAENTTLVESKNKEIADLEDKIKHLNCELCQNLQTLEDLQKKLTQSSDQQEKATKEHKTEVSNLQGQIKKQELIIAKNKRDFYAELENIYISIENMINLCQQHWTEKFESLSKKLSIMTQNFLETKSKLVKRCSKPFVRFI